MSTTSHRVVAQPAQRLDAARAGFDLVLTESRAADERAGELGIAADEQDASHDETSALQVSFRAGTTAPPRPLGPGREMPWAPLPVEVLGQLSYD